MDNQQGSTGEYAAKPGSAAQKPKPKTASIIIYLIIVIIAIALLYYLATGLNGANYKSSASTTTGVQNSGLSGNYVLCMPSSSQFGCSLSEKPILHNYSTPENSIVYGTFINLYITQRSGRDWNNVNIAFVPQGTASNNGVPEVNFNPQNQLGYAGVMTNGTQNLVLFIPVSNSTSGMFKGQLWAQYHNGFANATPVYADIANITINAST
jgi:hypothetical protein